MRCAISLASASISCMVRLPASWRTPTAAPDADGRADILHHRQQGHVRPPCPGVLSIAMRISVLRLRLPIGAWPVWVVDVLAQLRRAVIVVELALGVLPPWSSCSDLVVLLQHGVAGAQRLQLGRPAACSARSTWLSAMYSIAAFFISRPPRPRFFSSWPSIAASARRCRCSARAVRSACPRSGTARSRAACRSWSAASLRLELPVLVLEALGVGDLRLPAGLRVELQCENAVRRETP